MKTIIPDFYNRFECKASDCKHSCCKGWEIDIDEDSYEYYQSLDTEFGRKILENTFVDKEGAHYRLDKDMRCPFLQKDGLCEMILTIGEESLCDICALHPRFYEDYTVDAQHGNEVSFDAELAGVGLSCEKVCELLWSTNKPLEFLLVDDSVNLKNACDFSFQEEKYAPRLETEYVESLFKLFQKTEPIDEEWTAEMQDLISHQDEVIKKATAYASSFDEGRYTRLLHYIAFRQLESMGDSQILLNYATRCTDFVFLTDAYFFDTHKSEGMSRDAHTMECIRRFSEQIEYSTQNVNIIMEI